MQEPLVSDTATFNLTEAAKVIGVHPKTIQYWIKKKRLPVHYMTENRRPFVTGMEDKMAYKSRI